MKALKKIMDAALKYKESILLAAFLLSIFYFVKMPIMWDEIVYNLNAKYFLGLTDFYDNFRPPLYSAILMPFYALSAESLAKIIPNIFLILFALATYYLAKSFSKKPLIAALFLLSFPVVIYWSNSFMTCIPSSFFIVVSVIFLKKYENKPKFIYLALSFLFSAITFLTRYPLGLSYGILVLLYFIFVKNKNLNHFILSQFFFFIPVIYWIKALGFELFVSIFQAAESDASTPLFFMLNYFLILGLSGLLLPLIFRKKFEKQDLWLIIPVITFLAFFQLFGHKETRFLMPLLPFIAIMLSRIRLKEAFIFLAIILSFVSSIYLTILPSRPYYNIFNAAFSQVSEFFLDKPDEVVLSNMVAYCLYYTKNQCLIVSWEPEYFINRVDETNASYLLISDNSIAHPYYSSNQSYYEAYALEKKINIGLENIYIYKIEKGE